MELGVYEKNVIWKTQLKLLYYKKWYGKEVKLDAAKAVKIFFSITFTLLILTFMLHKKKSEIKYVHLLRLSR